MNTKLHAIVDGLGNPVEFLISAGNDADSKHAIDLLKKVDITKSNILGDKAYGSKEIRSYITENGESYTIPRFCEKISVNSTTVIKNDIVGRLEKQPLNFFTVYNKYRNLSSFFNSQSAEMERSGMEAD